MRKERAANDRCVDVLTFHFPKQADVCVRKYRNGVYSQSQAADGIRNGTFDTFSIRRFYSRTSYFRTQNANGTVPSDTVIISIFCRSDTGKNSINLAKKLFYCQWLLNCPQFWSKNVRFESQTDSVNRTH